MLKPTVLLFALVMLGAADAPRPEQIDESPSHPPVIVAPVMSGPPGMISHREPCRDGCLTPVEAIAYASYLAPKAAVAGEFEFLVKAVGGQRGRFFLNSETDYRDRNNLTVALSGSAARMLAREGGREALEKRFLGKRITVEGIARRVRIDFTADGEPTGKFYHQVHVSVSTPSQIWIER